MNKEQSPEEILKDSFELNLGVVWYSAGAPYLFLVWGGCGRYAVERIEWLN